MHHQQKISLGGMAREMSRSDRGSGREGGGGGVKFNLYFFTITSYYFRKRTNRGANRKEKGAHFVGAPLLHLHNRIELY